MIIYGGIEVGAESITVAHDGSGDFETIQEALDDASEGDIIEVRDGRYYENVVVNKRVDLEGESSETTIIDGHGEGITVHITMDRVNMSGFKVMGSGDGNGDAGIKVEADHCEIKGNNCSANNRTGILLTEASQNKISDNKVNRGPIRGINLLQSDGNNVSDNTCDHLDIAIDL